MHISTKNEEINLLLRCMLVYAHVLLEILNADGLFSSHKLCLEVRFVSESVRSSGSICCLTFMKVR